MPGDWCTVEADGSLTLLGRGSICINTGGEKVFPEEVEEVLKKHEGVSDALVLGLPDERFGQKIVAVVQPSGGPLEEADMIEFVRAHLARYKSPKHVVFKDDLERPANGKADYKSAQAYAEAQLS